MRTKSFEPPQFASLHCSITWPVLIFRDTQGWVCGCVCVREKKDGRSREEGGRGLESLFWGLLFLTEEKISNFKSVF